MAAVFPSRRGRRDPRRAGQLQSPAVGLVAQSDDSHPCTEPEIHKKLNISNEICDFGRMTMVKNTVDN